MVLYGTRHGSAWELLTWALKKEYGCSALPEVLREDNGKPYFPALPRLRFSLSDSGSYSLCAISSLPVGVDIEVVRPRRETLTQYALTEREYQGFLSLGGDWPAFYTLWTRREAWCKYTGAGLAASRGQDAPEGLEFASYSGTDWRAAVCGEETPPAEIIWVEGSP